MKRILLWSAAAGAIVLFASGCVDRAAQQQAQATQKVVSDPLKSVAVRPATVTTLTEDVEVTGDVTASEDTTIGSKQNNRVVTVFVKDGDQVTAGQLLAVMDDTGAQAQLKQAQAQVMTAVAAMSTARSQVAQATQNLTVGPHKTMVGIQMAQAQAQGAKRNLDKMVTGMRPEEKRQAELNVASAKSNLDLQQKQLDRIKKLVSEGAIAGQNLDTQQATYDQALAQYNNAKQSLEMANIGNRQEDIDAARSAYQQALENIRSAQDQKRLDPLLKDQLDAAKAQVESAKAQLDSARAQIAIANQTIADTKVFAPFSGTVSGKPIQAGTVAGPATPIVRLIGNGGVYFSGQIPGSNIDKVHQGDGVTISVDGLPGKTYAGKIVGLNPLADNVGRLFSVRVQFTALTPELRAGMFARGAVAIRTIPNAEMVPATSVLSKGDTHYVFIVDNNKAKQVTVTTGLTKDDFTQVTGLPKGANVVVDGQNDLVDGAAVKVKGTTAALNDKPGLKKGDKG